MTGAAAALLAATLSSVAPSIQERPVRIALVAPLSGPSEAIGRQMHEAADRAVRWINSNGGLLGQDVVLEVRDDGCDPARAEAAAHDLVTTFRPHAVIGHCAGTVATVAPIYEGNGTLLLAPTGLEDVRLLGASYQYVFRMGVRSDLLGERAAEEIVERWGGDGAIGIVSDGSPFGDAVAASARRKLEARRIRVAFQTRTGDVGELSRHVRGGEMVLLFTSPRPPKVDSPGANEVRASGMLLIGMPGTPDAPWADLWRWTREHDGLGEVEVLAPSPIDPRGYPETPLVDVFLELERPSLVQIHVLAAFDLLRQAIEESGTAHPHELSWELRRAPRPTLLGPLQSGETGVVHGIPLRVERFEHWTPSRSVREAWTFLQPENSRDGGSGGDRGPASVGSQYNVIVEPSDSSTGPLVLDVGVETTVRFSIGDPREDSVVSGIEPDPILDEIAAGEDIHLTVTLFTDLAAGQTYQQEVIRYRPAEGSSTEATFTLLPSPEAVGGAGRSGHMIFVVDADGMEIDVMRVAAFVGAPPPGTEQPPPAKLAMEPIDLKEFSLPDLVLSIAPAGTGKIPVVLRAFHSELDAQLKAAIGDAGASYWKFASGLSQRDLEGLAKDAFADLHAIVEQNNEELQRIYRALGRNVDLSRGGTLLNFSEADRDAMLTGLESIGRTMYWRLFVQGSPDLQRAMKVVESFAESRPDDTPLRLRILSADVYAPWQILYPPPAVGTREVDAERFWGFRYELGTLQLVSVAQGRFKTVLDKPPAEDVVFAAWRRVGDHDTVAERAEMLADYLEAKVGDGVRFSDSRSSLLGTLQERATTLSLIFAYGHGSSGTELAAYEATDGTPVLVAVPNVQGPCLIFGEDDYLTPRQIDELHPGTRGRLLEAQPIVILNACETGTSGIRVADNNGFVGAFTRSGARAIVVTEAPVWSNFAYHFGRGLLDRLFEGQETRRALRETRLEHLREWNNPLGLVYTLYGNPGARIQGVASAGPSESARPPESDG